jgi:hypothetical protein
LPLVVGLTVVAYGTSPPEMAASLQAAVSGRNGLAVGNVVGSNIFNVLFILGASALITSLVVTRRPCGERGAPARGTPSQAHRELFGTARGALPGGEMLVAEWYETRINHTASPHVSSSVWARWLIATTAGCFSFRSGEIA